MPLLKRLFLVGVCSAALLGAWGYHYLTTTPPGSGEVVVVIPRGSSVRQIARLLQENGLIAGEIPFLLLTRVTGTAGKLRAGEYAIARGLKPGEVLRYLVSGPVLLHRITIPEGLTMVEIGALLAAREWMDATAFPALVRDRAYLREMGLEAETAEGYLFPDTYSFTREEAQARTAIRLMVDRFHAVWKDMDPERDFTLDQHQVVTLASIIEKETAAAEERPLIARVFLNRLRLGMRLQSDPTVIYGKQAFDGTITKADLKAQSPYNTYVISGLPPGPICNPGRASLAAVFSPAESKALYFVSRNDGTHYFSTTLQEHNRMVRKFQRSGGADTE